MRWLVTSGGGALEFGGGGAAKHPPQARASRETQTETALTTSVAKIAKRMFDPQRDWAVIPAA
jgi:hypothetical protein